MLRRTTHLAIATALVAVAAAAAPAAHASRVGFNVSIGGPGYAVAFGDRPYFHHRHYYHRHYYRPAPVYVAPPVVYVPPRVVYRAPRVVYWAPYVPPSVVIGGPVYYRY